MATNVATLTDGVRIGGHVAVATLDALTTLSPLPPVNATREPPFAEAAVTSVSLPMAAKPLPSWDFLLTDQCCVTITPHGSQPPGQLCAAQGSPSPVGHRQILEKLQREGLLDKNKATVLVAAPLRIGLITSANSAACADFIKTLEASPFSFQTLLAAAAMQGQASEGQVVATIRTLVASGVEVICLVRGGGSPLDLAWFDDEAIGRAIANCPVPVWVGIGHEIDLTVPDFVAHTPHKTPTAVAEGLVERIRVLDNDLALSRDRLLEIFSRRMELADRSIVLNRNGLQQGARKHLEIHNERFLGHVLKLESALDTMILDLKTMQIKYI